MNLTHKAIFTAFLLLLTIIFQVYAEEEKWQLYKYEDGIALYDRIFEQPTNLVGFKATTVIPVPLKHVFPHIKDLSSFPKWFGRCSFMELIMFYSYSHVLAHYGVTAPWPVKDRDIAADIRFLGEAEDDKIQVIFNSIENELIPLNPRYTRIKELKGEGILEKVDSEHTSVDFRVTLDSGKYLPQDIIRYYFREEPFLIVRNLKQIAIENYQPMASLKSSKK